MTTKEGSTKIENFMTLGAGVLALRRGHISHIVKIHYFFKKIFFSTQWYGSDKLKVMMNKEGSTKIVNVITPGAGVLVLGRGHISRIVKMHYSFKNLYLYSQA